MTKKVSLVEISNSWLNLCWTVCPYLKISSNIKSTNELVLLIISLANPGFKSHVNLKTIQNEKQEGQHSIHLNP